MAEEFLDFLESTNFNFIIFLVHFFVLLTLVATFMIFMPLQHVSNNFDVMMGFTRTYMYVPSIHMACNNEIHQNFR